MPYEDPYAEVNRLLEIHHQRELTEVIAGLAVGVPLFVFLFWFFYC